MYKKITTTPFFIILITSLFSCSTNTVEHSIELSTAGVEYSNSVSELTHNVSDRIIEYDNNFIKRIRPSLNGLSEDEISNDFQTKNDAITNTVKELKELSNVSLLLKEYFTLLGEASKNNDEFGETVSGHSSILIDNINNLYTVKDVTNKINDTEKGYISDIASIASKSFRAQKIKFFIKEAAMPISQLLVYNGYLLEAMKVSLEVRERVRLGRLKNSLMARYRTGKLDEAWMLQRKEWIKSTLLFTDLNSAMSQSDDLKKAWKSVVSGKQNLKSFANNLKDLSTTLKIVNDYHAQNIAE